MKFKWTMPQRWRSAAVCAGATVALGLMCIGVEPLRHWFERLSYDWPFLFAPSIPVGDFVIIERDENSYRKLKQDYDKLWDRRLDAKLLDRLTADQARLVVFDVFLSDAGEPAANRELAEAIRKNGHVILAMDYKIYGTVTGAEPIFPQEEFTTNAAGLGVASVLNPDDEADRVVRSLHPGYNHPSLAWAAAAHLDTNRFNSEVRLRVPRWLNYSAAPDQFRRISYSDASEQEPGFFAKKFVFIGGAPRIKKSGDQTDEFATPFERWGGGLQPGVIIQATAFLNLVRGNWLERVSPVGELLMVLALGALSATMFSVVRPWLAAIVAAALVAALFAGACALTFTLHRWFSWMIVAGAEIPFALGWSIIAQARKLAREKELVVSELALERAAVERLLPATESEAATIRSDVAEGGPTVMSQQQPPVYISAKSHGVKWLPPSVPDHTLVRCIGEGSYGQVWLASDVIGTYHAVKFVYRRTFDSDAPFDREFKGIHHFTPISRMHPGFVNILHVGRSGKADYFFYIMELADDETSGQKINPETYAAKTLSRLIRTKGRLPAAECVELGLELSSALEYLHQQRLIHRDIKPSNVLFVHGKAKFADVGLVTQIETRRDEATYIGTEGYIAPEGPGSAGADVYSLGKVLYEASMGLDRMRFPDLPTTIISQADPLLMRLNEIILKACEFNSRERYQSAQALYTDLQKLMQKSSK